MRVRVRLFAVLREAAGRETLDVELVEGSRVADLYEKLAGTDARFARFRGRMAFAVNGSHTPADRVLEDGDEVALLPPVSGGAR